MPSSVSHGKRHGMNSTTDHKPIPGALEDEIVTIDLNGLPARSSGVKVGDLVTGLIPKGGHNASTGYPSPYDAGWFWWITTGGTLGGIVYNIGDWIVAVQDTGVPANDFQKIDNTDSVTSVDGRTSAVTLSDLYAALVHNHNHSTLDQRDWNVAAHNMNTDLDMDSHKVVECTGVEGPAATNCGIEAGATFDCYSKLGDKTGANSHEFRDSDGVMQAKVNSLGKGQFKGADLQNSKITNMANGVLTNDAMAYGQRYTDAEARLAVKYRPTNTITTPTPSDSDVNAWSAEDRGIIIGSTGRIFYCTKVGTAVKYSELNELKTIYFDFDINTDYPGAGNYRYLCAAAGASGNQLITFIVPEDFKLIESCDILFIPTTGAAGTGKDIDLYADFGSNGEVIGTNQVADTTSTYNLGTGDTHGTISALSALTGLGAGDRAGLRIVHNAIGGTVNYLKLRLRYWR